MRAGNCEVCGRRAARYICQECGRGVCQTCLEPHTWLCSDCYNKLRQEVPTLAKETSIWLTPFKLFLLGFLLIFVGTIFMIIAAVFLGASVGATIWVLPFPPIFFGAGPHTYPIWLFILAVALTILSITLFLVLRKQRK